MIYFVDEVGPSPLAQNVAFRDLPLHDVLFLSERLVIGVGFYCNPMVLPADEREIWSFIRFLEERKIKSAGPKYGSQLSGAFWMLYGQPRHGLSNGTNEQSRPQGRVHENCINCIVPLGSLGSSKVMHFSTSGLDGKLLYGIWRTKQIYQSICNSSPKMKTVIGRWRCSLYTRVLSNLGEFLFLFRGVLSLLSEQKGKCSCLMRLPKKLLCISLIITSFLWRMIITILELHINYQFSCRTNLQWYCFMFLLD